MPPSFDNITASAVVYQYSVIIELLEDIQGTADQQGVDTVAQLALEARRLLEAGGLTPARVWLQKLEGLSAEEVEEVDPRWLHKSYHELEPLDQGRWLQLLRGKGWTFARLQQVFGHTPGRMHQLLRGLRTAGEAEGNTISLDGRGS